VVAVINNQKIEVVKENFDFLIPIRPVCEALGIDTDYQNSKIKDDEILSKAHKISYVVASDGSRREMATISLKYFFGWLFSINANKIKPEAKEMFNIYKSECYDALYERFVLKAQFYTDKDIEDLKLQVKLSEAKQVVSDIKNEISENKLKEFEKWKADKQQLQITYNENGGNE
jgi:hypothetical protein